MTKRPWIPIAVVLVLLLATTLLVGRSVSSRLSEAELALDPFVDPAIIDLIGDGSDFSTPPCENAEPIADAFRSFYDAVAADQQSAIDAGDDPVDITTTDATFDSFLLESAIARLTAGDHQLLLRARSGDGGWCVDEVEYITEK